jgi:hypothetical protein
MQGTCTRALLSCSVRLTASDVATRRDALVLLSELLCDLFVVGYLEKFPSTASRAGRAAASASSHQPTPGASLYSSQQVDLTPDEQAAASAEAAELSESCSEAEVDADADADAAPPVEPSAEQEPSANEPAVEETEHQEDAIADEWELEEDVLRFLKTVALHRCVTGTPSAMPLKLLDDIFLVLRAKLTRCEQTGVHRGHASNTAP